MKKFLLAMFATMCFSANATIIIDDFGTGAQFIEDDTVGAGGCEAGAVVGDGCFDSALGSMLGGERDLFVNLLSSGFGNGVDSFISTTFGVFSFNVGSGSSGSGELQYDGVDGSAVFNTAGLGSVDLSGLNALVFDVLFADAGFRFDVEFCSSGGVTCQLLTFNALGTTAPIQRVENLSQWNLIDFADVSALRLLIDPLGGSLAVDLTLDQVSAVPEPGVIALLGGSILLLGFRRIKHNRF